MATPQDVFQSMMRNVRSKAQDLYNRADRDKDTEGFQFTKNPIFKSRTSSSGGYKPSLGLRMAAGTQDLLTNRLPQVPGVGRLVEAPIRVAQGVGNIARYAINRPKQDAEAYKARSQADTLRTQAKLALQKGDIDTSRRLSNQAYEIEQGSANKQIGYGQDALKTGIQTATASVRTGLTALGGRALGAMNPTQLGWAVGVPTVVGGTIGTVMGENPLVATLNAAGDVPKFAGLNKLTAPVIDPLTRMAGRAGGPIGNILGRATAGGALNVVEDEIYNYLAEGRKTEPSERLISFGIGASFNAVQASSQLRVIKKAWQEAMKSANPSKLYSVDPDITLFKGKQLTGKPDDVISTREFANNTTVGRYKSLSPENKTTYRQGVIGSLSKFANIDQKIISKISTENLIEELRRQLKKQQPQGFARIPGGVQGQDHQITPETQSPKLGNELDTPKLSVEPTPEQARADFQKKWQETYGNRPTTEKIDRPKRVIQAEKGATLDEMLKVEKEVNKSGKYFTNMGKVYDNATNRVIFDPSGKTTDEVVAFYKTLLSGENVPLNIGRSTPATKSLDYSKNPEYQKVESLSQPNYTKPPSVEPVGEVSRKLTPENLTSILEDGRPQDGKLSDIIDYPELFNRYPEAKDIPVRIEDIPGEAAHWDRTNKKLVISPASGGVDWFYKNLIHELQHFVQQKEGGLAGGIQEGMSPEALKKYLNLPGEVQARASAENGKLTFSSPQVGKVGGEVTSPILSSDPGTRKGIRTGQEKVTDLLSKTKLEKPSKGGMPTRTKASSEVSLESIIPKKGKLNLARLATDDVGKQALEDINRELPTSVITNKSVIEKAKTAKGSKGALSDEKMQEMIAQQLKNRQQVVDLSAKFSKAKADGASEQELAKIMLDLSNQSRVAQQGGTFAGRLLQAQNIIADQSASPMQKILALLDNAGVDQAKYTKDAIKVNWDNPTEVVTFYRKYVPPKLGEVLDEIRYTNMLSSPLTHIVNTASNALQSGVVAPVEKTITGLLDAVRSSITGAERKYYANAGIDYTKGYIKSLPEAWTKAKNIMSQKEISLKPDMEFVPTGVGGPLQVYTTPLRALEAMDQFFRTLVKGGVTEELGKSPQKMTMARIAKGAEDEANYRLFRQSFDPNGELGQGVVLQFFDKWNSAISNLRRLPGGKWVLPFLQTPTNILKQGFEFSPLGVSTMVGAKNPLEQLSKAIIGTGVFATAYQLAQSGLTSWDAPTGQKERELYYAAGMQPYSIKIGDKWVSFSKLGPLSYPIAMAAALGDAERTKPDQTRLQAIGNSIGGMLGFFGDQSYVRSIGDLVEAIQGGVSVGPNAIAGQTANFAGQMIPYRSFLTWMGRMIDPTYRKATTFTERLKKDLPIMGSQLEPHTDPSGKPSMRDLPFLNAVSPFRVSQEKEGVKLYDQYKEARIQRNIEKRMAEGLEEGQSVGTGTTYQYMKDGDLKKIDIGKVSQMPEGSEFNKLKKKKESFKLVDDILDNLEPEQQAEALNKLGISSEDAQYYNIARQDNDLKYAYVQDQIAAIAKTSKNREDFLKFLVEGRKNINGQMIISNGVIDDLYDANLITAEEKKQLKNFEYDPTTQQYKLKSTGRGSGARLKQIQPIKRKIVLRSGKEFVNSIKGARLTSEDAFNKIKLGEGIRLKMPS